MATITKKSGKKTDTREEVVRAVVNKKTKPVFDIQAGDNAKYMNHNLQLAYMDKIDSNDPMEVENRVIDYFKLCEANDVKPSYAGFSLALGVNRSTLSQWLSGRIRKPREVVEILEKAYAILNAQMEDYMQDGKIPTVNGIFLMKNNLGYRDQTNVVISPQEHQEEDIQTLIDEAKLLP